MLEHMIKPKFRRVVVIVGTTALFGAAGCGAASTTNTTTNATASAAAGGGAQQQAIPAVPTGRPGAPSAAQVSALASKLGVSTAKLQAAMQAARPAG
ncbi:MAG: hypothetical protein JWP53_3720, partial [Conexibacter sp.]|nr:hypothetical protein [Conexibacter sp.]